MNQVNIRDREGDDDLARSLELAALEREYSVSTSTDLHH